MAWNTTKLIQSSEITGAITEETVKFANEFGAYLGTNDEIIDRKTGRTRLINNHLTSSQLRNFFGEVKRQQMQGFNKTDFILLKPKLAYAVGRSDKSSKIKDFYFVLSNAIEQVSDEKSFRNFIKIFEAIVAYHKKTLTENNLD